MSAGNGQSQEALTSDKAAFSKPPWWHRRTQMERKLFFALAILVTIIVVLSGVMVLLRLCPSFIESSKLVRRPSPRIVLPSINGTKSKVCHTHGCIKAAASIMNHLDETRNPCENFYNFACGGWMNSHVIQEHESHVNGFSEMENELQNQILGLFQTPPMPNEPKHISLVRRFLDFCMDTRTIDILGAKPLLEVIKVLGGWPVVEGEAWKESDFDWLYTLRKMRELGYDYSILVNLMITGDDKDNKKNIIRLEQPIFGLPDREYYIRDSNSTITAAYMDLMIQAAVKLGAKEATATSELLRVFQFETALANLSLTITERRNVTHLYNKITVRQLQTLSPQVHWLNFLNGLLVTEISQDENILVESPKFLEGFSKLISETDSRVLANYMIWRVVKYSIPRLSKEWRNVEMSYKTAMNGVQTEYSRWKHCLYQLEELYLPWLAVSALYVSRYFAKESKDGAVEIEKYVHGEFRKILKNVDWMDEQTRRIALEKDANMIHFIGYPQELRNITVMSKLFEKVEFKDGHYFSASLTFNKWVTNYMMEQLRQPNKRTDWHKYGNAAVVNAQYWFLENSIEIPAGILQNMFYSKDRPQYMNFGSIGAVIGHEITHGFDDKGRQYDKEGKLKVWWNPETDARFKERAQCIIDQYSNYGIPALNLTLDGVMTQGENVADNGGLKEAYLAYLTWVKDHGEELSLPSLKYNPKQLFWITFANLWCENERPEYVSSMVHVDIHSLPEFRVIGTVSNQPEFAADFNCPIGSPMNPKKKCAVW